MGDNSIKEKTKAGKKYERNRKADERGENVDTKVKKGEIAPRVGFRTAQESRNSTILDNSTI